ncbi:MAG TPA: ABC transporter ATP-binding protein [Acidimicrobiales bacterium]|nr:ABC transporter ATP-binding protein [Acidimicrobiales bacterium]
MSAGGLLRGLLRDQRRAVAAGAASGVVWMVALAAVPLVISRAVDDGVVGGDGGRLAIWLLVIAGVTAVQVVAGGARHWLACRLYYGTTAEVSGRVTARVSDPCGGVDDRAGDLVSLVTSDAPRVGAVADLCCRGTGAVVAIVGVAAVMVTISPPLAAAVLAAIAVLVSMTVPLLRPLERRATDEQRARAVVATATADLISGHRVLHGLGAVAAARRRFATVNDAVRTTASATAGVQAALEGLAVVLPGALLAITVAVGSALVADGSLTVGQLVGFLAYGQFLLTPVATLVEVGDVWTRGVASAARVVGVLHRPAPVGDDPAGAPLEPDPASPAIAVVGAASVDGSLACCTLAVDWGEVVAVAAPESRAARALAGLLAREHDPAAGAVLVGGVDVRTVPLADLRRAVVVAHGDGLLLDETVRGNVAFGRRSADPSLDDAAMATAAVDEVVERLPFGADTRVGERGRWLSGGQRQRVGLARALAAEAPVLVLVDPTSAVDAHTERAVITRLVNARRSSQHATLLITSSSAVLGAADRVVRIDGSRAVAGTAVVPR